MQAEATPIAPEAEVARVMQICNACRYCESYCAVFPAMTRRLQFDSATTHYLANLCHGCGACLHACQYAPPHEFAVNVPVAMARVRMNTYRDHAWPGFMAAAFRRSGAVTLALAIAWSLVFLFAAHRAPDDAIAAGSAALYRIFPHGLLVGVFAPLFMLALLMLLVGVVRFWRGQSPGPVSAAPVVEAGGHALRLTYLGGGHGEGCNEESDRYSNARRVFHHLLFYGFASCFAATGVATIYHYGLALPAPYGLWSLPVVLGVIGGIGMSVGAAGLLWLNLRRHPQQAAPEQRTFDCALSLLLLGTAVSGLAVLALRGSVRWADGMAIHLGLVAALFCVMPWGKFAHGVYRGAALLKWTVERRRPDGIRIASD